MAGSNDVKLLKRHIKLRESPYVPAVEVKGLKEIALVSAAEIKQPEREGETAGGYPIYPNVS